MKTRQTIGAIIFTLLFIGTLCFVAFSTSPKQNKLWFDIRFHQGDSIEKDYPDNTLQENIRTTSPQADSCIRAIKMKRKKYNYEFTRRNN